MVNNPQPASPVISPRTSTASGVFSQVRDLVGDRLEHSVSGVNRMPHLIAASRASRPQADISNDLVAEVADYSPLPGQQVARHMRLDLQNNPGRRVDQVADAIQRYLNIEPRREVAADPKAEDSIVRHPQQIIQSNQRWNDATYYQFASNGAETYQIRPEYRAWGGGLELKLENEGSANIFAPATSSPQPGSRPLGQTIAHDPVRAAQDSMAQLQEMLAEAEEPDLALPPMMSDNPYFDPATAANNASRYIRQLLSGARIDEIETGGGNISENPALGPARAWQTALGRADANINGGDAPQPPVLVGPPNAVDDPLNAPNRAWSTTTVVEEGLVAASETVIGGGRAAEFRPRGYDEAYVRVMRIIDELNIGRVPAGGAWNNRA